MYFRLVIWLISVVLVSHVTGHGRLIEPPSRSSMWRIKFNNPINYQDNELFCGGRSIQWEVYNGKCGVCGDSFGGPRDNEAPTGKYANGLIVRTFEVGASMEAVVHLTANHKGTFEFRLCQNDDPKKNVSQECFNQNLLRSDDGTSSFAITNTSAGYFRYTLRLPSGLRCRACVLQWKYNTGNSWGVDFVTKKGCIGCGPQEQFYGCSDIAVGHSDVQIAQQTGPAPAIPDGDVDENKWEDTMEKEQNKQQQVCTCSGAYDMTSTPIMLLNVFIAVQCLHTLVGF